MSAPSPLPLESVLRDHGGERLVRQVPWVLDGTLQQPEAFLRALRNERARLDEMAGGPTFSLLTPLWNTPPAFLDELVLTCLLQTWTRWELLLVDDASQKSEHLATAERWAALDPRIALFRNSQNLGISGARNEALRRAKGDHVAVLDHDDLLHPQILGLFARVLRKDPSITFLYSNEVKIDESSRLVSEFFSKPDFDLATLERANYVCHFTAVARRLLDAARTGDGLYFRPAYDGVEDHDLFLRLAQQPEFKAEHLPVFGYYWRKIAGSTAEHADEKPYVRQRAKAMLGEYFATKGLRPASIAAQGERGANTLLSVRHQAPDGAKLAVIVPFKDRPDLTLRCLDSLERQTGALSATVVLVDNDSREPETAAALGRWLEGPRRHRHVVRRHAGAFNYAKINNDAIAALDGDYDYLLLLNNDVELTAPETLSAMAGELAAHPRTAFVGLRLHYPGGDDLQHGGIRVHAPVAGLGFFRTSHADRPRELVADEHVMHAVTFACAMTRLAIWRELGGLEEDFLPNGFGDTELCSRAVARGYVNFYLGTLVGTHHESKTRLAADEQVETVMLSRMHAGALCRARNVQMGYNLQLAAGPASPGDGADGGDWFELQLRYRIADAVNETLKRIAGPFHGAAKRWLRKKAARR